MAIPTPVPPYWKNCSRLHFPHRLELQNAQEESPELLDLPNDQPQFPTVCTKSILNENPVTSQLDWAGVGWGLSMGGSPCAHWTPKVLLTGDLQPHQGDLVLLGFLGKQRS